MAGLVRKYGVSSLGINELVTIGHSYAFNIE